MNTCNMCVCVCVHENTSIRQVLGWGGVLRVLVSALCLPILLILMEEVQGEWLKFGDYLRYSCVIVEKTWTLNSYFLVLFFEITLSVLLKRVYSCLASVWTC